MSTAVANFGVNTGAKLGILAGLYFAQGLPYGFFRQALPVMMRDAGASLPEIGLASLLALPWALKFLWAPLVDRFGLQGFGVRKTWIAALQVLGTVLFLVLGAVQGVEDYSYLMWGFFFANLIAATQDIATDGLAVTLLGDSERGFGNGLQVAGYRLGMIFGGGALLMLFPLIQWRGAFWLMGLLLLATTLPVLFVREPVTSIQTERVQPYRLLWSALTRPGFLGWALMAAFYKFGDAMATAMLNPFLRDRGFEIAEIGRLSGVAGSIAGLVGAMAGGILVQSLGRYTALVWFGVIQAFAVAAYLTVDLGWIDEQVLVWLIAMEHFTGGLATVALFTAMMDVCRPEAGSTEYTLQAGLVVVGTMLSSAAAGFVAEWAGYAGNFMIGGGLSLAAALLFGWLYRGRSDAHGVLRLTP